MNIMPTQFRVIVTVRPRYACGFCEQGVVHRSGRSARRSEDLPLRRVQPCSESQLTGAPSQTQISVDFKYLVSQTCACYRSKRSLSSNQLHNLGQPISPFH